MKKAAFYQIQDGDTGAQVADNEGEGRISGLRVPERFGRTESGCGRNLPGLCTGC